MLFCFFFCNIIKVNYFLYRFIILLHLISSFSVTISLLVPHAYFSIESTDCILLSSFELKAILLISSVKKLCLSLLNLCCVFNINLLFLMNSLCFLLWQKYVSLANLCQFYFFLDGLSFLKLSCF